MPQLTPKQLDSRRSLDFDVLATMDERCPVITVGAYRTAADLKAGKNRITNPNDGHLARHYRVVYRIPTLVGPGKFNQETCIHIDCEVSNFPYTEPASWVLSETPWSPHFMKGAVVCTGEHWQKNGKSLVGHLVRHHAKLLNWAEEKRGGGYRGWNGTAIDWHTKNYGNKPLDSTLKYPEIPLDVAYGIDGEVMPVETDLFGTPSRRGRSSAPTAAFDPDLFAGAGRRSR